MASYFDFLDEFERNEIKLVDLRSPCEFAQGAMPFAVNVPLFTDEERAEIGTIYKQTGATEATQLGLEKVAQKMELFLDELTRLAGPQKRLAIHCWRGGLRSGAVAKLLEVTGITPIVLKGGYKAYRGEVLPLIDKLASHKMIVLNGRTGSGKTDMIRDLIRHGAAAIDFEDIASHRGSAIGDINIKKPQPTQQNFENTLASEYFRVQGAQTLIVEIEQDIGQIRMPQKLRAHIYNSEMVLIECSLEDRVSRLEKEYASTWGETEDRQFNERMRLLKKHIQGPIYRNILELVATRKFPEAIRLFLTHRYDPCYDKTIARQSNQIKDTVNVSNGWNEARQKIIRLAQVAALSAG